MQLGLVALAVVFLGSMGHSDVLRQSSQRKQKRISTAVPPSCSNGCEHCSVVNGCLKCKPRLFILLERNDIRQVGVCLASCPVGYYGVRYPEMNKCFHCKLENCEACFNHHFCTKCKDGLYSHRGRCYHSCPEGFSNPNGTTDCVVPCELAEWSPWGPCMKKNKTCGFKKGHQTRSREPVQALSPESPPCPPETERQKCTVQKKIPCGNKDRVNKSEGREEQRNRDNGKNRGRDGKGGGAKEARTKGGGAKVGRATEGGAKEVGSRRRKAQKQATTTPALIHSTVTT